MSCGGCSDARREQPTPGQLTIDLSPLRDSAPFRRLWFGSTVSAVGSQMTTYAVVLQVYRISGSSLAVGGVGLATALPAVLLGLYGGTIVDAHDRRRLVLITTALQTLVSLALLGQALAGSTHLAPLYALVALAGLVGTVHQPARRTFVPRLLPTGQIAAGTALTALAFQLSVVVGPALAGLITAAGGLRWCYAVDVVTFAVAAYGVWGLPPMRPEAEAAGRPGWRAVGQGLAFLRRSPVLSGALLADLNATVLAMPVALFPAIAADRFDGSPTALGLLSTSLAAGSVVGGLLSGPVVRIRRQGRGLLVAGAVWGLALAGFGAVDGLVATLGCLAVAGAADITAVTLRSTIVQTATPDALRGRIGAAESVVGVSMPQVGNFRAGLVASATSPATSAVAGGLLATLGAGAIALALPALARYRAGVLLDP